MKRLQTSHFKRVPASPLSAREREPEVWISDQRPVFGPHDRAADRAALVALAQWCHRFSPYVGLEGADALETLLLDATNLAPLYGSEAALIEQVSRALRRRGLAARLALADTLGAAWGLAHYDAAPEYDQMIVIQERTSTARSSIARGASPGLAARGDVAVPNDSGAPQTGGLRPRLVGEFEAAVRESAEAVLPAAALRLPQEMLDALAHLGIVCVGDVLALPREQLRSRFGPLLLLRIDQWLGRAREAFAAVAPPLEFAVEQAFEYPLTRTDAIRFTIEKLLERLARLLAARQAGALAVACRVDCEGAPTAGFEFGLFEPTASARQLLEIADLQLERLRLAGPAVGIEVRVLRHAPLEERQGVLFEESRALGQSRPLAALVNRLAGRLGRDAVVRCRLVSDAQPERAFRTEPLVGRPVRRARRSKPCEPLWDENKRTGALDRPLTLLAQPAPLEMMSVTRNGPPISFRRGRERHTVARHWGPERIETGWWRRQYVLRDYYRVETTEGRRFWLFRRRPDGAWFLHACFQ